MLCRVERGKIENKGYFHNVLCLSEAKGMNIKMEDFQIIDNCLMVKLPEEVDHYRATYICEKADKYILQDEVQHVVFDFEDTRFMDSSGIGIIMGRYRKIACFGGKVYVIHVDRQIKKMLTMSGLTKVVEVLA